MHFIFYLTFFISNIFYQPNDTKSKWFIKDSVLIEVNQRSIINYNSINYDTILRVPLINKDKINLNDFDLLNYDEVYLYKKTGGILYKLINNELIRIDNSYDHKLHQYSLKFFHQNKINILGGYGFFNRRNDIIFFSNDDKEWYSKRIKGDFPPEGISEINFHFINGDNLIICGGKTGDPNETNVSHNINDCFDINLKNNISKKLSGTLNKFFQNKASTYIQHENSLFVFYDYLLGKINIESKEIQIFDTSHTVKNIIGINQDKLYFFENDYQNISSIQKIKISDFQNSDKTFLLESSLKKYLIFPLIILICIVLIMFFRRTRKNKRYKVIVESNMIFIENNKFTEDKDWIKLINQLNKLDYITNNNLLSVIGNDNLNIGHQNRLKNQLIKNINLRSKFLFKDDLILEKKLKQDNRIKIYYLNSSFKK